MTVFMNFSSGQARPGSTSSPTYGQLGPIQAYGYANPAGPYAGLQQANKPGSTGASSGISGGADSAATKYLQGVVGGQNTPYNESTRNSMYSQASGMNAAAEGAQNQQAQEAMAMGGASSTDPSAMSVLRQNMASRQGANQRAMGQIESTANIANQQAQQQAANSLLAADTAKNAQNQAASQAAMNYLYGGSGGGSSNGGNNFTGGTGMGSLGYLKDAPYQRTPGQSPPFIGR
jgi:hypothetical protein